MLSNTFCTSLSCILLALWPKQHTTKSTCWEFFLWWQIPVPNPLWYAVPASICSTSLVLGNQLLSNVGRAYPRNFWQDCILGWNREPKSSAHKVCLQVNFPFGVLSPLKDKHNTKDKQTMLVQIVWTITSSIDNHLHPHSLLYDHHICSILNSPQYQQRHKNVCHNSCYSIQWLPEFHVYCTLHATHNNVSIYCMNPGKSWKLGQNPQKLYFYWIRSCALNLYVLA